MGNEYKEYLEKELKEAQEKFEEAKREAIKEIENMNFHMAEDFGAAHTTPCLGCFIEQSRGFTGSGNKIYRTEGGRAYGDVSESRSIFPGDACAIGAEISEGTARKRQK